MIEIKQRQPLQSAKMNSHALTNPTGAVSGAINLEIEIKQRQGIPFSIISFTDSKDGLSAKRAGVRTQRSSRDMGSRAPAEFVKTHEFSKAHESVKRTDYFC